MAHNGGTELRHVVAATSRQTIITSSAMGLLNMDDARRAFPVHVKERGGVNGGTVRCLLFPFCFKASQHRLQAFPVLIILHDRRVLIFFLSVFCTSVLLNEVTLYNRLLQTVFESLHRLQVLIDYYWRPPSESLLFLRFLPSRQDPF